jgi:hypothetical protein
LAELVGIGVKQMPLGRVMTGAELAIRGQAL